MSPSKKPGKIPKLNLTKINSSQKKYKNHNGNIMFNAEEICLSSYRDERKIEERKKK